MSTFKTAKLGNKIFATSLKSIRVPFGKRVTLFNDAARKKYVLVNSGNPCIDPKLISNVSRIVIENSHFPPKAKFLPASVTRAKPAPVTPVKRVTPVKPVPRPPPVTPAKPGPVVPVSVQVFSGCNFTGKSQTLPVTTISHEVGQFGPIRSIKIPQGYYIRTFTNVTPKPGFAVVDQSCIPEKVKNTPYLINRIEVRPRPKGLRRLFSRGIVNRQMNKNKPGIFGKLFG